MAKSFAILVVTASASPCSDEDRLKLQGLDDIILGVGDETRECGIEAFNWYGPYVDHDEFIWCMTERVNISSDCAGCYYAAAVYDYVNCDAVCGGDAGWCAEECLECTAPGHVELSTCTDIPVGSPKPCTSLSEVATSLGCDVFAGIIEDWNLEGTVFAPTDRAFEAYLGPNPWDCFNRTRNDEYWQYLAMASHTGDIVRRSDMFDGMFLPDRRRYGRLELSKSGTSFSVSESVWAPEYSATITVADNEGHGRSRPSILHVIDDVYWPPSQRLASLCEVEPVSV